LSEVILTELLAVIHNQLPLLLKGHYIPGGITQTID